MKNLLIGLIVGSAVGGMWVQYHFTDNIWSNIPKQPLSVSTPTPTPKVYNWYFDGNKGVIGFSDAPLGLIQDYCLKGNGITTVSWDGMMETKCSK